MPGTFITVSSNGSIYDVEGHSITMGGSATIIPSSPVTGINAGGEISMSLTGSQPVFTGSFGVGAGTPAEGHQYISTTTVK